MRLALVAFATSLAMPAFAAPPTVSAADMKEVCTIGFGIDGTNSPSSARKATCVAYLDAVVATVAQVSAMAAEEGGAAKRKLFFCLPAETTHEQLARTYYRFLQANETLGNRAAAGVALAAFADAWPCKG